MEKKKKPALIHFSAPLLKDLDAYAKGCGISRNAAVNLACSELLGETERLKEEADRLRSLVIKLAMSDKVTT